MKKPILSGEMKKPILSGEHNSMFSLNPWIAQVNDYHEFGTIVEHFKEAGIKVSYKEFATPCGRWHYSAVFFMDGKATSLEVKMLIKTTKASLEKAGP